MAMKVKRPTGGTACFSPTGNAVQDSGLTLLDWFAGQALAGLLASDQFSTVEPEAMAKLAYAQAHAMLEGRP